MNLAAVSLMAFQNLEPKNPIIHSFIALGSARYSSKKDSVVSDNAATLDIRNNKIIVRKNLKREKLK